MRYSALSTVFGLVATVLAQDARFDPIFAPNAYEEVPTGEPFTITWSAQPEEVVNARISISLIGGPEQNTQVPLYTIAADIDNSLGSFVWTPNADEFGKNFYGLVIKNLANPDQFQYSNPFKLVQGSGVTPPVTTPEPTTTEAEELPTVTPPVSETTSAALVPTSTAITAEAVPTYVPPVHNNSTVSLTRPSTLSQVSAGTAPTGATTPVPPPTGGAVGQTISMALVGAGALVALAF